MNELEKIFDDIYLEKKSNSAEIIAIDKELTEYIGSLELQKEKIFDLDGLSVDCAIAYEKQGFINGFRYAVKLLTY